MLAGGGWSAWDALIFLCLLVNAPWLGLSAATGLVGFAVRLLARDPVAAVLPAATDAEGPVTLRTVVAICVRLEDMAQLLPPAAALLAGLRAGPEGEMFSLAILSDTPDGEAAAREAAEAKRLAARFPPGAVSYRRRAENTGFKAGNLMSFLDAEGQGFDAVLVLDADSAMTPEAVRRLVCVMQADPALAIVQPLVAGHGAETRFARLVGFGHRPGARSWATGQAWWQGAEGPYWGHNALIRIAPFRAHARLPVLPDGALILSHDHVEAALLHGAGWGVCVLPDDAGSFERHPPDLVTLFARDRRWAAGNLQYRYLLRRPEMGRIGRMQMGQAILHYLLTPLWFAPLPLAALNVATGGAEGTPRGALLLLLLAGWAALHLPKLAGHAEALLRESARLRDVGEELLFAILLDPIAALERSLTILRPGRDAGWAPLQREGRGLAWATALRRFGPHLGTGLVLAALFASGGAVPLLLALPALAGLLLAVPLTVWTARPDRSPAKPQAAVLPLPVSQAARAAAPAATGDRARRRAG